MAQNVEVKLRITSTTELESRIIAIGAKDHGVISQRDTYFGGGKRLKLREFAEARSAELIAYDRSDSAGLRTCQYKICPIADPASLKETLAHALDVLKVVEKTRHLFMFEKTRIHLDTVKGLGTFLELEVILDEDEAEVTSGEREAEKILSLLQVEKAERIAGSYLDLHQTD